MKKLLLIAANLACAPIALSADPSSVDELFALDLDSLREVKVGTAARRELTTRESPGAVTVFTREEIQSLGVRTLDELLNFVPGMRTYTFVGSDSSGKAVVESRGIYNPNGYMVLLMIDGQRINSQYTGNFTGANRWVSLTPFEKVEVVRGPGSALYGGNAMLAVINLISASDVARNSAFVEGGSFAHKRVGVQTGVGSLRDWHWRLWAEWQEDDGDDYADAHDPLGIEPNGTSDPRTGRDLQFNAGNEALSLLLRHHKRRSEQFYLLGRMANDVNVSETEQNNVRVSYHQQYAQLDVNISASYLEASWEGLTRIAPQGVPPFFAADLIAGPSLKHDEYQFNADLIQHFGERDVANYGISWEMGMVPRSASVSNYNTLPPFNYYGELRLQDDDAHRLVGDVDREVLAAYLQWDHQFDHGVRSVLGARMDAYDPGESEISPRAALVWQANDQHIIKAQYSKAFIPPSQADQFIRASLVLDPPSSLKPMSGTSWELAWLYDIPSFSAGFTFYFQEIEELIGRIPAGDGKVTIANSGTLESSGVEVELSWQVHRDWLVQLHASHVFKVDTSDAPPDFPNSKDYAVRDLLSAISHWRISDHWQLDVQAQYGSEIAALNNHDGFSLWHAHMRYALNPAWELYFGLRNINDEQCYSAEPGLGLGVDTNGQIVRELPQRGRQWQAGLRWNWQK